MKRLYTPALGLLAGLLLSACTLVPTDSAPRAVSSAEVPSGLLNGAGAKQAATVSLWFYDAHRHFVRRFERISAPLTISTLVSRLALRAPRGLSTAVPSTFTVSRAIVRGSEVTLFITTRTGPGTTATTAAALQQIGATLRDAYGVTSLIVENLTNGQTQRVTSPVA